MNNIEKAIANNVNGFRKGWIDSIELDKINDTGTSSRDAVRELGYDYHPALGEQHPTLYVKLGHPAAKLSDFDEINKSFIADQKEL